MISGPSPGLEGGISGRLGAGSDSAGTLPTSFFMISTHVASMRRQEDNLPALVSTNPASESVACGEDSDGARSLGGAGSLGKLY